ncbi:protein PET100 homolog, mitochondrial isoform X1 [Ursus maritimus]|uniref:Protein PET100 homolog, mitochondrial isoform X1 n=1 Tax=Ursus maritimus TaxID=29073 RepID=A0A384DR53_URSMA|nr:protein PET100 homolog, mitochondrial isoform X1 [Ursus maritimus]
MGVKLEVFRMTLYLTFPVAMFWIANQAEWFEDYVIQRKPTLPRVGGSGGSWLMLPAVTLSPQRELWPPEKEDQRRELEEFKERIRKQREEKLLRAAQQSS